PTPGTMTVVDSFTPFNFKGEDNVDADLGPTSVTLLPDFPGTAHPHEAILADKGGNMYLVDQDNMGEFNPGGPDRVLQEFKANTSSDPRIYSSPVFFDGKVYIQGDNDVIKAFALKLDPATNTMLLDETPVTQGTIVSAFPGTVESISADGTRNGIVWSPQVDGFASDGPAILRAYDANNLSTPLYASNQAGPPVKLTPAEVPHGGVPPRPALGGARRGPPGAPPRGGKEGGRGGARHSRPGRPAGHEGRRLGPGSPPRRHGARRRDGLGAPR